MRKCDVGAQHCAEKHKVTKMSDPQWNKGQTCYLSGEPHPAKLKVYKEKA